jgi:predicted Zn finger-like uncharacterized protein
MKISCQSCPAKYTIADEKVVGKVVKIRCKKCGATIVVNGNDFAPSAATGGDSEASWTVNVSDGDQRTMTGAEIAAEYRSGVITDDTYCWKDGMADWLPLRDVYELASQLHEGASVGNHSGPPAADFENDGDATAMMRHEPSASSNNGYADAPQAYAAAAAAPVPAASAPTAARRAGRGAAGDLFGGLASAGSEQDVMTSASLGSDSADSKLTGQRNENSVLFSLNALTSKGGGPAPFENRTTAEGDGSGLIDIRALSQTMGVGSKDSSSKVDDIMNLSGGGAFGAALTAPALSAPILATAPGGDPYGAPEKSSIKGLIIAGIIGGFLLLAILGVGAMLIFKTPDPQPVAMRTPGSATVGAGVGGDLGVLGVAAGGAAATPTTDTPKVAAVEPNAAAATTTASGAAKAVAAGNPKAGTAATPATAEKVEKPVEKPAEKPKDLASEMAKAGGGGGAAAPAGGNESAAPFDRGAAGAAMSGAAAAAQSCKKPDGPTGGGHVKVTFAPNGSVSSAVADAPPFAGTAVGGCVAAKFRAIHIPAFAGSAQGVGKSFTIN